MKDNIRLALDSNAGIHWPAYRTVGPAAVAAIPASLRRLPVVIVALVIRRSRSRRDSSELEAEAWLWCDVEDEICRSRRDSSELEAVFAQRRERSL